MKKMISILLALALLCGLLAGCSKPGDDTASSGGSEPASAEESGGEAPEVTLAPATEESDGPPSNVMRVLIDLQYAQETWVEGASTQLSDYNIRNAMEKAGWDGDFAFEYLPKEGEERANALQRMRVEIMAGKGPDVFILACAGVSYGVQGVFRYPEQMMNRRMFLPLDDYIKNAKYMEWDQFIPQVMEAGRNDEGQQILPISYSIPVTIFDAAEVRHEHSATMTFQDMVDSGDPALRLAASGERLIEDEHFGGIVNCMATRFRVQNVFPRLADYDTEELTFTKDELLDVVQTQMELCRLWESEDRPAAFQERLLTGMGETGSSGDPYYEQIGNRMNSDTDDDRAYTMIPVYNTQGGCTAVVTSYAAISRNTKFPDDAFLLLDYLMSKEFMMTSFFEKMFTLGLPVRKDLPQPGSPVVGMLGDNFALSEENFQELQGLIGSITNARFRDSLDAQLEELMSNVSYKWYIDTHDDPEWDDMRDWYEQSVEEMVDESYRLMRMMLGES